MKLTSTILLAFCTLWMIGCKKEKDVELPESKSQCRVQSVVRTGETHYDSTVFILNGTVPAYWQMSKSIYNGTVFDSRINRKEFRVTGSQICVIDLLDDSKTDTIIVDQSKQILERRTRELYENCGEIDTILTTWKYAADITGNLKQIDWLQLNLGQHTSSNMNLLFSIKDGDLMSVSQYGKQLYIYTYYDDLLQPKELISAVNKLYVDPLLSNGAYEFRNTHLLKNFSYPPYLKIDYDYVLDDVDGKILKVNATVNTNGKVAKTTERYYYDCE